MPKIHWKIIFILFCLNLFVWFVAARENRDGILTVVFLDVSQGDSIFIDAPSGNQVLIDGGRGDKIGRELSAVMPFYDRSIDMVVATHPDEDHIGGLIKVLNSFDISSVLDSGFLSESSVATAFGAAVDDSGTIKIIAARGMEIDLGAGVFLYILHPTAGALSPDSNSSSIVTKLVYGETEVMLTGDAPIEIEKKLVFDYRDSLKSDILKLGHHGSKTSSSDLFLAAVSPQMSIVSSGKENRYGHPHKEVIDRALASGASVFRTDELGRIIFKSDGVNWKRE